MAIQQMLLGAGAAAERTYVDDVFSTYLYTGTGSSRSITTGIDMTKGGLVWHKPRGAGDPHWLFDTVRGTTKVLSSSDSAAESTEADTITAFNNNGYTLGASAELNPNNTVKQASWTFRKAPGFFDVVTWSGNGVAGRQISHNLGSRPGLILLKCTTSGSEPWYGYHRDLGATKYLRLNSDIAAVESSEPWNNTEPTSTNFTLAQFGSCNGSGNDYVAYVFAGGESTASDAVSVDFNGSSQYLSIPDSTDYEFGSGDFTVECWLKADSFGNKNGLVSKHYGGYSSWRILTDGSGASSTFKFIWMDSNGNENTVTGGTVYKGQWTHVAVSRSGNTIRMFVNGLSNGDVSFNNTIRDGDTAVLIGTEYIGSAHANQYYFDGQISNVRIVKGTGVYTSSFKPSTTALTSITNTKLLCCQSSTVTTATTITGSITNNSATASTDSPFDDPAGFVFGDAGDQNVIKCGFYLGDGANDGPEINLGWEPQWILLKNSRRSVDWILYDSMRGIVTGGDDPRLEPNTSDAESSSNKIQVTSTGFKILTDNNDLNEWNKEIIYMCMRRPDGYVGKPPELGTGVFAMDTGNGSSTIPTFDSGFPVDWAMFKNPTSAGSWYDMARQTGTKYLVSSATGAEGTLTAGTWDSNTGWAHTMGSQNTSWMWKRHAGFDVVTYAGSNSNRQMPHSLNKVPEMIWVKNRDSAEEWAVYHKGLNGGTNPEQYFIELDNTGAEVDQDAAWNDSAPTSTHFSLGVYARVNNNAQNYIAMLFASVDGISSVGSYSGSNSDVTISLSFTPRFFILKRINDVGSWQTFDSIRGMGSGNDEILQLNDNAAQIGDYDVVQVGTNQMVVKNGLATVNTSGNSYIYYAHA